MSLNQYFGISGLYGQESWPVSLMPHMADMQDTVGYNLSSEAVRKVLKTTRDKYQKSHYKQFNTLVEIFEAFVVNAQIPFGQPYFRPNG